MVRVKGTGRVIEATPWNNGLPPPLTAFAPVNTARVASRVGNPGTFPSRSRAPLALPGMRLGAGARLPSRPRTEGADHVSTGFSRHRLEPPIGTRARGGVRRASPRRVTLRLPPPFAYAHFGEARRLLGAGPATSERYPT